MLFCVGLGSGLIDVATQAGCDAFVIAFSICVPYKHDPAVHFCQLGVGDNPCRMFGWHAKCKREPRVNLTVASHLKFVAIANGQEPIDCWCFNAVCAARVGELLKHFNLDDNKNFERCGFGELVGT